jgi:hypothetical protein
MNGKVKPRNVLLKVALHKEVILEQQGGKHGKDLAMGMLSCYCYN